MALTTVNTGDIITASQHNEIQVLLKTTTAKETITTTHHGANIASAGTLQLGSDGNYFHVTGTTGVTALSTVQDGTLVILEFDGALTLTHNATSLILQGGANITTAAGDVLTFISEGSGNWRQVGWTTSAGFVTLTGTQTLTNKTLTAPVISTIVNTGTLTLPTSTDTLVGKATTDTLTNKTLTSPVVNTQLTGTAVGTGASQIAAGNHTTPAATATVAGHVPTPPNNTTTFLRGDATWAAPTGGTTVVITKVSTTSSFSTNSATYVDVTGLSIAVTTAGGSNNVEILAWGPSISGDGASWTCNLQLYNSTDAVAITHATNQDSAGNQNRPWSLYSMTTLAAVAKTIKVRARIASGTLSMAAGIEGAGDAALHLVAKEYR